MKQQICITIDEKILLKIMEKMRNIRFRSKSHLVEVAINCFLKEEVTDE